MRETLSKGRAFSFWVLDLKSIIPVVLDWRIYVWYNSMCKEMLERRCMLWQGSNVTLWQSGGGVACMTHGRNARKL